MNRSKPSNSVFRVNQVGYAVGLPVRAAVLALGPVRLTDANGNTVRDISFNVPEPDEASGDRAELLDLGCLEEGVWGLSCNDGMRFFSVRQQPWRQVTNALIKGLYYQRCGFFKDTATTEIYTHPACHTAPAVLWEDRTVRRRIRGGWHDAGDYGKYVGPGSVAAAHLMYAHILFPEGCSDPLNIPETGNGVPDILNEARYELEWLLQMQRPDGAFHHKLAKARFSPFIMPQDDTDAEYLMPVSHCATAAASACLALGSRVYRDYDSAFANAMLLSALRGWEWLLEHPDFVPFKNPEGVRTGQYGEQTDADDRFWAACELYAATGNISFRSAAEELYALGQGLTRFGWADVGGMGALCCLFCLKEKAGDILYTQLKRDFLSQSAQALELSDKSAYGTALPPEGYVWGSILPVMSRAVAMIADHLLNGNTRMRDAALVQWSYALGLNALDICFVTGFGERSVMNPHHRPSGADGIDAPVPGLISGGPNKRFPYPATRERLGDTPPARYFLDETPSADTNEIAVYWNSVTILAAAFFNRSF